MLSSNKIKIITKRITKPLNDDDILYTALWQTCAKYNHSHVLILPLHIYKETNPCIQGYQKSYKKITKLKMIYCGHSWIHSLH